MIGYVTIGVKDMAKAKKFYIELLSDLGARDLLDMGRIAFVGESMKSPMLAICTPYDGGDANCGNGNMIAIPAGSKEAVDKLYNKAIELGATCDGGPGQRIPNQFYGAYIRDPDNNKMAFFHFG